MGCSAVEAVGRLVSLDLEPWGVFVVAWDVMGRDAAVGVKVRGRSSTGSSPVVAAIIGEAVIPFFAGGR